MTVDEFIALPDDDGVDRMLIGGRLWEKPFAFHDRRHSSCEATIAHLIGNWVQQQSKPRGSVFSGGAGFILQRTPGSVVGIDVAYVSHEVSSRGALNSPLIERPPTLAVEILSKDTCGEVNSRISAYLNAGVECVWVVELIFQTVTVYGPKDRPRLFSGTDVLDGGKHMPGFEITVNQIFED